MDLLSASQGHVHAQTYSEWGARLIVQAEDADRATARAEAADDDRAALLSRLQDVHREKARQMSQNVAVVQQVRHILESLLHEHLRGLTMGRQIK
jgi:hypothetical protein